MIHTRRQVADEAKTHHGPRDEDLVRLDPHELEVAQAAAEQIIRFRLFLIHDKDPGSRRPWGGQSASDMVAEYVGTEHGNAKWHTMLTVANDIAKTDRRYYGVRDPSLERYCSVCRKVHDIGEFDEDNLTCRKAEKGRQRHGRND